ncbi:hypothetical protein ACFLT2_07435 [Acidobacteriota bacterium]
MIGSTEWVEEYADALRNKVVVNFNMDSAIFNIDTPLFITASPTLIPLIQHCYRPYWCLKNSNHHKKEIKCLKN